MVTLERRGLKTYFQADKSGELKPLFSSLTHFMDGAQFSEKYRSGFWDGKVKYYDLRGQWFWFGLIDYVVNSLKKHGITFELYGYDELDVSWVEFSQPFLADNRDYQRDSILSFLQRGYGTIMVPTRGGKTFISSEIIRLLRDKYNNKALFLVDNTDLFNQAIGDISLVVGIPKEEIGRIKGEEFSIKDVNIAMIQTLQSAIKGRVSTRKKNVSREDWKNAKLRKRNVLNLLKSIDLLVIDEVQEYGTSRDRIGILRQASNARFILSISATPHKYSNNLHKFNVESICGSIVYEIEEKTLISKGVLAKNRVLMLICEHEEKPWLLTQDYRELFNSLIIKNPKRNGILLMILSVCYKLKLKTLAMFNSVEHGELIKSLSGYEFLSGVDNEDKRIRVKEEFLRESDGVLLVSDIWKKGITLPSVEVFINVDGGRESSLVIQRRGRVLGVSGSKKKALTIDFIDDFPKYFSDHTLERIKAYEEKLDENQIDVLDTGDSEFTNLLEDYLINWFELNIQS